MSKKPIPTSQPSQSPDGIDPPQSQNPARQAQYFDAIVGEGTSITFGPTGEKIRIMRVGEDRVTLEKTP